MAQLDLTNAHIQPYSTNPTLWHHLAMLENNYLYDVNVNAISDGTKIKVSENNNSFRVRLAGTFTASGTEFYIVHKPQQTTYGWKVTNVSFAVGDTYDFSIDAHLTVG